MKERKERDQVFLSSQGKYSKKEFFYDFDLGVLTFDGVDIET